MEGWSSIRFGSIGEVSSAVPIPGWRSEYHSPGRAYAISPIVGWLFAPYNRASHPLSEPFMATPILAPTRPRARSIVLRIAGVLLIIAVLAFAGAAAWFYSVALSSLPQLDGKLALRGLSVPVTVTRDHVGVPHILAATTDD